MQGESEVRSDLYALAATMHHLLSGRPPVLFRFPPARTLRPEVSPAMEAVLERSLKLHADERYGTAREMRETLEGCGADPAKSAGGGVSVTPAHANVARSQHVGSSPPPAKAAWSGVTPAQFPLPPFRRR